VNGNIGKYRISESKKSEKRTGKIQPQNEKKALFWKKSLYKTCKAEKKIKCGSSRIKEKRIQNTI